MEPRVMPHRLVCVAILLFWAIAAGALFRRDILPDLLIGTPPDLRSISRTEAPVGPTHWGLLVAAEPSQRDLRSVGQAITESTVGPDGRCRFSSEVLIDSGHLLTGTPFETVDNERLRVLSASEIDPSGNLDW